MEIPVWLVDRIAVVDGCWLWTGGRTGRYGKFPTARGRGRRAHRVVYERLVGAIPVGLLVLHSCDRPLCVNPDHLRVGTHADNARDMVERGRVRTWATERERLGSAHPRSKLTEDVVVSCRERWAGGESSVALAREHGVAQATMHAALTGKTWGHV